MANAVEVSEQLVRLSGHPELVSDARNGDYSPHTDNRRPTTFHFLNSAMRRLDKMFSYSGETQVNVQQIEIGQYQFSVPNLRHIDRVEVESASGIVSEVCQADYEWLRNTYPKAESLVERGRPIYWARRYSQPPVVLSNTDFSVAPLEYADASAAFSATNDNPSKWLAVKDSNWTYNAIGKTFSWSKSGSGGDYPFVYQYIGETFSDGAKFLVDVTIGDGVLFIFPAYWNGTTLTFPDLSEYAMAEEGIAQVEISPSSSWNTLVFFAAGDGSDIGGPVIDASTDGVLNSITVLDSPQPVQMPNLGIPWFTLAPPSDAAYTLRSFGGYYSQYFSENSDETWWSINEPDILTTMARGFIEQDLKGNQTRARMFFQEAAYEVSKLNEDQTRETVGNLHHSQVRMKPW